MTFTHEDIQARLIEFLYGELDGQARAAFDAHIGGCEACRKEVNEFAQTRATARAVVRAPLGEPLPEGVRARVLEAAARASAERASVASAPAVRAARPDGGTTSRWLAWLRARWTLPMLTTVAAMGALLLFRETIFREARRPLGDTTADELLGKSAPAAPTVPLRGSPASEAYKSEPAAASPEPAPPRERQRPVARSAPAERVASARAESEKAGKKAMKPARAKADADGFGAGGLGRSENKDVVDQLLGKMRADKLAGPADVRDAKPKPQKRHEMDDLLEGLGSGSGRRSSPQEEESRAPAKSAADDFEAERDQGTGTGFAQPPPTVARKPSVAATPPPPPAPAPRAPAPAPAARAAAPSGASARMAAEAPSAAAPSANARSSESTLAEDAPAAASREKKSKARAKSAEPSPSPATPSPARDESAAAASKGGATPPAADPTAALVDRAEKLMTARRFSEAAAVYKDLLRRFPQHAAGPTWRRRLAAAQVAAEELNQSGDSGFAKPPPPR